MQVNISNEIASQANLTVIVLKKYWFHLDNSVSQGYIGKQPSSVVLRKRCFENMQQIYRETPMLKRDFNKVAKQLYWNRTSVWVFPVNLQHIFRTPFLKNTSDGLLFYILIFVLILLDLKRKIFKTSQSFKGVFSSHRKISFKFPSFWRGKGPFFVSMFPFIPMLSSVSQIPFYNPWKPLVFWRFQGNRNGATEQWKALE